MKIFLVWLKSIKNVETSGDFSEAFICKAESEEEAKNIVPFHMVRKWGKPEDVEVEYLGEFAGKENLPYFFSDKRILLERNYRFN